MLNKSGGQASGHIRQGYSTALMQTQIQPEDPQNANRQHADRYPTDPQPADALHADGANRSEQLRGTDEPFPDHHHNLAATLKFAWQMVWRGVHERRPAVHTPVVATHSAAGPQTRVLVLRAVNAATRTLTFYNDVRSAKAFELAADNRVAVTFFDAPRKVQLRAGGAAFLHSGDAISHQR